MESEIASGGANTAALLAVLPFMVGALLASFIVWGLLPCLIVGGVVLIGWNLWRLTSWLIAPLAKGAWVLLNLIIQVSIMGGAGYALWQLVM